MYFIKMGSIFRFILPTSQHQLIHFFWGSIRRWHSIATIQHFSCSSICHSWSCEIIWIMPKELDNIKVSSVKSYNNYCCGTFFDSKSDMRLHRVTVHDGKKSFDCTICDKKFPSNHSLNCHLFEHSQVEHGFIPKNEPKIDENSEKSHCCLICNQNLYFIT